MALDSLVGASLDSRIYTVARDQLAASQLHPGLKTIPACDVRAQHIPAADYPQYIERPQHPELDSLSIAERSRAAVLSTVPAET